MPTAKDYLETTVIAVQKLPLFLLLLFLLLLLSLLLLLASHIVVHVGLFLFMKMQPSIIRFLPGVHTAKAK